MTNGRRAAPITVALVNDYEIIVRGLQAMLEPFGARVRVVDVEVGGLPDRRVDVALFDTFAGRRDALDRAAKMVADDQVEHVVLYTWDASDQFLRLAREIDVSGVVLKSATGDQLVDAVERIAAGERIGLEDPTRGARTDADQELSVREREVLALLALGHSNRQIATELFLSVDTVKTYVRRVFSKLGVNNRTQAALRAAGYDLAPPAERFDRSGGRARQN